MHAKHDGIKSLVLRHVLKNTPQDIPGDLIPPPETRPHRSVLLIALWMDMPTIPLGSRSRNNYLHSLSTLLAKCRAVSRSASLVGGGAIFLTVSSLFSVLKRL